MDSDKEIRNWIAKSQGKKYDHIYEIYMDREHDGAVELIENSEKALIAEWAEDEIPKIISLGPGFPLRENWTQLRAVSYVMLFRRSPQGIYASLKSRRKEIFEQCPNAQNYDNWDVGVMVDEQRLEYSQEKAIANIERILSKREIYYGDKDEEVCTDKKGDAISRLKDLHQRWPNKANSADAKNRAAD